MSRVLVCTVALVAFVALPGKCQDAPKSPLQNLLAAFVVGTDAEGQEQLTPAEKVEPGQTVEYQLICRNLTDEVLRDVQVVGPVPESTQYLADSAKGDVAKPRFSIDGGKTFHAPPVRYTAETEDGEQEERIAPPAMYTHVAWALPKLTGKAERRFRYRVRVK